MNCAEINVESASFSNSGATVSATSIETCADDETLTLKFSENLPLGTSQLNLAFTGILNDQMRGFYRSSYTGNFMQIWLPVAPSPPLVKKEENLSDEGMGIEHFMIEGKGESGLQCLQTPNHKV